MRTSLTRKITFCHNCIQQTYVETDKGDICCPILKGFMSACNVKGQHRPYGKKD